MNPTLTVVRTERVGDVTVVTVDDGKANAMSFPVIDALQAEISGAAESSRAIVLAGRPGIFSAGLDLAVVKSGDRAELDRLFERCTDLYRTLLRSPVPIVAACSGHALAGGALLLLCSDWRVGLRGDFRIGFNEMAIGMPLPEFGSGVARVRLERSRFVRATVLAELTDPAEAVRVGFLDETVERDVVDAALRRAGALAPLAGRAYAVGKHIAYRELDGR
jgi:enoyl-CoA hydratase